MSDLVPASASHFAAWALPVERSPLRAAITAACRGDERESVHRLVRQIQRTPDGDAQAAALARCLVGRVRARRSQASGVDALMQQFSLSSEEGVALMCLAEALLRIPDPQTADRLIADKLSKGDWRRHLGESSSLFVNAATWGLVVTGALLASGRKKSLASALTRLIAKGGEPLIRQGVDLAMRLLGDQFVSGQTIEQALANSLPHEARGYRYSYDMLGEAALTAADAERYFASYEQALHAIGKASAGRGVRNGPGISVKLSALHPRYVRAQKPRVMRELLPRLKDLFLLARRYDIGLNIDAEEADRLELSLDLFEALAFDADLAGFDGMGIVVQAYQKRCPFVLDYLIDLAARSGHKFMVRLVKGAYWDSEIKRAQVDGLAGFPVYTRKCHTDVSYLACAQKLLGATERIYPQFATHNAQTLATIYTWAQAAHVQDYEFQCLHGMGETLYDEVVGAGGLQRPCRIYAPVGSHETLLAYLVRRLLENGANSSFVNQIVDVAIPLDALVADPVMLALHTDGTPHAGIAAPQDLFGVERKNSSGLDLSSDDTLGETVAALARLAARQWHAAPLLVTPAAAAGQPAPVTNPARRADVVGSVHETTTQEVAQALAAADAHAPQWRARPASERAALLLRGADALELNRLELIALALREAGKTLANANAEVREAVDFLRYYAAQIRSEPDASPLGTVVCISPWNFPLAIFLGQIGAALAAGNVVLAKPAEQTPLIAHRAVQLLHEAGIPRGALQFLPGRGETVGAALIADARVRGVIFTGSLEVAQMINRTLARRALDEGREIPLIAETGGQNAMIVDSSALPEQVVQDVLASAFDSAGQRCSALRVLCLQSDIAERVLAMLRGAMQELRIGDPARLDTDVGPVIDEEARAALQAHVARCAASATFQLPLPQECAGGSFVAPTLIELADLSGLQREVFGPVLHVLRFQRDELLPLIDTINALGYGLTLGVHSRIDDTLDAVTARARVGNIYVNRNMVGAVVGVQPFGGEGKSGTGPKAGGPWYLRRLQRNEHHAPDLPAQRILPGPTGERNTLTTAPRGAILCAGSTVGMLLHQLAAVRASGNTALMSNEAVSLLPAELPAAARHAIRRVSADALDDIEIAAVLADAASLPRLLLQMAARQGALVALIETREDAPVPLWRLLVERAVCVNTTAAGGNASLMMLRDGV